MMNERSFQFHCGHTIHRILLCVALIMCSVICHSCYSLQGGSVPDHIKTLSIASVVDNSGFGDITVRETATEYMFRRFRSDNSLQLVDENGDARLTPVIVRIQEQIQNVQQGDLEKEKRIVVVIEVEYFDAVKNRLMWKKTFENFDLYDVTNATVDRQRAAQTAIRRCVDDILLAVVSNW